MFRALRERYKKSLPFRFFVYFLVSGVAPLVFFLVVIVLVTMGTAEPLSFKNVSTLSPFYRLVLFVLVTSLTTMLAVYVLNRRVSGSVIKPISTIRERDRFLTVGQLEEAKIPVEEIPPDEIGNVMEHRNLALSRLISDEAALVKKEKFSALGQLSSFVAHDFRGPLAAIVGAADCIEIYSKKGDEKRVRAALFVIRRETLLAQQLINNLLDFSREAKPKQIAISVASFFSELLALNPAPRNIEVLLDVKPGELRVLADPLHLRQVCQNLVQNAFQAMPEGGRLTICGALNGNNVEIHFRDTGPGINPAEATRIFEPLYSTKPLGTGLGLAIAKQLAETNKGRLWAENGPVKGADFGLCLPPA